MSLTGSFERSRVRRRRPSSRAAVDGRTRDCWFLEEWAGHGDPQAMQRLLRTAVWGADAVRDDVRFWLIEQLGHPDSVLRRDRVPEEGCVLGWGAAPGIPAPPVERLIVNPTSSGTPEAASRSGYSPPGRFRQVRVEDSHVGVFLAYVRCGPGIDRPPAARLKPRVATAQLRAGPERPERLPVGLDHHHCPVAAHPSQPHHRRAGRLLPLLVTAPGATGTPS